MSVALKIRTDLQRSVREILTLASVCDRGMLSDLGYASVEATRSLRKVTSTIRDLLLESGGVEHVGDYSKASVKPSKPKVKSVQELEDALKNGEIQLLEFFKHFQITGIDLKRTTIPEHLNQYVDHDTTHRVVFNERDI